MEIAEVHFSTTDIIVIIKVFETIQATSIADIKIKAIVNSLRTLDVIDTEKQRQLLQDLKNITGTTKNTFYAFLRAACEYVPFFGFVDALEHAGYSELSRKLIEERDKCTVSVSRGILKRELPNAKAMHTYYTNLKRCADNNLFGNQTMCVLNQMITSLDNETCRCSDFNRVQLLADKRCVLYFILIQQCCCIPERNIVLKRMRDTLPKNIDRTIFDTIFHSSMSFNWAICGDATTAEKHEKQARMACDTCIDGFVRIILSLWSQYKNNIFYLRSNCSEEVYLNKAKTDFSVIQQCVEELNEDEQIMWKTISVLDMVRSTVGMHSKFKTLEVCDIQMIEQRNVEYAKSMLDMVPVPKDVRRRMYYSVLRGRVYECTDRLRAKRCVEDALAIADDGCYDTAEKRNIETYLNRLSCGDLPSPSL